MTVDWEPATDVAAWLVPVAERLVAQRAAHVPVAEAAASVGRMVARLLPGGVPTPGQHLLTARVAGAVVGSAWLQVRDGAAFLYDVAGEVPLLPAVHRRAAELGAGTVRLTAYERDRAMWRQLDGQGYRVASSQLRFDVAAGTGTGARTELRDMTDEQWARFRAAQERDYAADLLRSGHCDTASEAAERSAVELAELLPNGRHSPGQYFQTAYAGGEQVGLLWYGVEPDQAFVLELLVHPPYRRRGYAAGMLRALHDRCRYAGLPAVGLSVFGFNHGARALYDSLGYRPTHHVLYRRLDDVRA